MCGIFISSSLIKRCKTECFVSTLKPFSQDNFDLEPWPTDNIHWNNVQKNRLHPYWSLNWSDATRLMIKSLKSNLDDAFIHQCQKGFSLKEEKWEVIYLRRGKSCDKYFPIRRSIIKYLPAPPPQVKPALADKEMLKKHQLLGPKKRKDKEWLWTYILQLYLPPLSSIYFLMGPLK